MAEAVERIYVEGDEDGWELVIETPTARHRFNIHGMASSGDLHADLSRIMSTILDDERG